MSSERVVFVTQLIDEEDPNLGFVPGITRALAARVGEVVVVANEVRAVPAGFDLEIVSLGKEQGASTVVRGARYQAALARLLLRRPPAALLAHMCPVYLTQAAPLAKATRTPLLLWYVHAATSRQLAVAERLADGVLTATPDSYPRPTAKLRVTGHSIDTRGLVVGASAPSPPVRLLSLGRTTAAKRNEQIVRAVADAIRRGVDVQLRVVGPSLSSAEWTHRTQLERLVRDLGVGDRVTVEGAVPRSEVVELLHGSTALVNASDNADKVVYEAMACERIALHASAAFDELTAGGPLGAKFVAGDVGSLADRIVELASVSTVARAEWGRTLRRGIVAGHSIDHWADQVAEAVAAGDAVTTAG